MALLAMSDGRTWWPSPEELVVVGVGECVGGEGENGGVGSIGNRRRLLECCPLCLLSSLSLAACCKLMWTPICSSLGNEQLVFDRSQAYHCFL